MTAHIFPKGEELSELPESEIEVYNFLSDKLNDDFYVFHSVRWAKKSHKWKTTWKENDFLVLNKKLGMLVLEVKGGLISYKDGVFHQKNRYTLEDHILDLKKRNDPLSQAIDGVYHYRKLFDSIEYDFANRFPVEVAVWFPDCEVESKINEFPLGYREISRAILDKNTIDMGAKKIYEIYDFYNAKEKIDITDEEFDKAVKLIAQDFDLVLAPGVKKGALDKTFLRLTKEQTGLLDYISEQRTATIQGVAGTGKTIIAKEAAKRFAEEGNKVLFLCFNSMLCADLEHRFYEKNVDYFNIHSFIRQYTKLDIYSSTEARIKELKKIDWNRINYKDIVIDEAQDFENDEIIYFKQLAEKNGGRFLVFYDKNQIVINKPIPQWIKDSECKLVLTKNCRNTFEVAITAYNVIDVELNQQIKMVHGDITTVSFVQEEPLVNLRNLIKYYIEDCGYEREDICILSLKKDNKSILNGITKIGNYNIIKERNSSGIFFTTARMFKGLESRVVIVIDVDEVAFTDDETKRVFYVACSRATQRLSIFIDGRDDKLKRISDAIGGVIHMPPKGRILQKIKAKSFNG